MLRESDKRSMQFHFGDHFINSRNHISWKCMDIIRRKLMLVTIGTCRVKREKASLSVDVLCSKTICLSSPIKHQENLESMSFKTLIVLFWGPTAFVLASPARTSILGIIIFSLINMTSSIKVMSVNRLLVSSVGRAPVCWAGGRGFKPRLDQHSGS